MSDIARAHLALKSEVAQFEESLRVARRNLDDFERKHIGQPCIGRHDAMTRPGQHYCDLCLEDMRRGWSEDRHDKRYAEQRG